MEQLQFVNCGNQPNFEKIMIEAKESHDKAHFPHIYMRMPLEEEQYFHCWNVY